MGESLKNKYNRFDLALLCLCDVTMDGRPNEALLKEFINHCNELPHARILMYLFNGGGELKNYQVNNGEISRFINNLILIRNYRNSDEQTTLLQNINKNLQNIFINLNGKQTDELINVFEKYNRLELLLSVRLLNSKTVNIAFEPVKIDILKEYLDNFIEKNQFLLEQIIMSAWEKYGDEISENSGKNISNELYFGKLHNVLKKVEEHDDTIETVSSDWCNSNARTIRSLQESPQSLHNYWSSISDYRFYRLSRIFTVSELCRLYGGRNISLFYNDELLLALETDHGENGCLTIPLEWQVELNGGIFGKYFDENKDSSNLPALRALRRSLLNMQLGEEDDDSLVKSNVTLKTLLSPIY